MESLRILMVVSEGPPTRSGIARTIKHLQDGLRARGHRVDVISYPDVPRAILGEIRLSGLIFHLIKKARRIDEYDIVHLHGAAPTVSDLFFLFARLRGLRPVLIYTHHCDIQVGPVGMLNSIYNGMHFKLSSGADEFVSTTLGYAAEIGAEGRTAIIPLGVDLDRFAAGGAKEPQFTALFVGQFRPYKGAEVLIRAAAQVHGMRLLMAGHGPHEQDYRALAAELGVDGEFHVGAEDEHIRDLYRRAHAIVLPSITRAEAFGLVLLEGMAAGCVPVASDLPGVREVLGRIGFTFPAGSVHGLATTLRGLRDNPRLVEQIGERARGRAAAFTWERTVADYERLFRALLAARTLRTRLAARDASSPAALQGFTDDVAELLEAERVEVVLRTSKEHVYRVASTLGPLLAVGDDVEPAVALLARYACDTGESVLLAGENAPRPLAGRLEPAPGSTVAAPLTIGRHHFGVLIAMREQPFDQRDLSTLTRLGRHVAPVVRDWQEYEEQFGRSVAAEPTPAVGL